MRKLLVCDLAGTVINEGGKVYRVLGEVLRNIGVPKDDLRYFHGMGKRDAIKKGMEFYGQGDVDDAYAYFKEELRKEYSVRLMHPNIPYHFDRLQKRGVHIALNTGYDREMMDEILDTVSLDRYVDYTIASDEVERSRPSSDMINALVKQSGASYVIKVGDTKLDIEEGRNAGAYTIGVLTGAGSRLDLQGADLVVPNIMRVINNDKII